MMSSATPFLQGISFFLPFIHSFFLSFFLSSGVTTAKKPCLGTEVLAGSRVPVTVKEVRRCTRKPVPERESWRVVTGYT